MQKKKRREDVFFVVVKSQIAAMLYKKNTMIFYVTWKTSRLMVVYKWKQKKITNPVFKKNKTSITQE